MWHDIASGGRCVAVGIELDAEADHTIPRAVCPELQNQVMNLELLPASLNRAKSDKITDRARVFAKELYDVGLLSEEGWISIKGSSLQGIGY